MIAIEQSGCQPVRQKACEPSSLLVPFNRILFKITAVAHLGQINVGAIYKFLIF